MVAAQSENEFAVLGVFVDLRAQALGDGTDGAGLLHTAVVRVVGGDILLIIVNDVVVVNLVLKVLLQIREQARLNQGHWGGLNALLHLQRVLAIMVLGIVICDCLLPVRH